MKTITVQPGNTLSMIARREGVSVQALVKANHISNPDLIRAGSELKIPDSFHAAPKKTPTVMVAPPKAPAVSVSKDLEATGAAAAKTLDDVGTVVKQSAAAVAANLHQKMDNLQNAARKEAAALEASAGKMTGKAADAITGFGNSVGRELDAVGQGADHAASAVRKHVTDTAKAIHADVNAASDFVSKKATQAGNAVHRETDALHKQVTTLTQAAAQDVRNLGATVSHTADVVSQKAHAVEHVFGNGFGEMGKGVSDIVTGLQGIFGSK